MNRLGKTIVFATHDMDLVKRSDMESINLSAGTMNNGMAA